jgi:OOP family OmpA-OmpF porin
MNSLDPDALDGIWSPTPHPPPAKEAVPGVVSVRLFGEDEDEITDEVQVVEHGAGYHAAQAQAFAPPPLTLILPDPPPPLAGTPHRSRSLFNGILAGVLLGGVLLWWAGDEPEEIPVTDQVVVEVIEPTVAEIEIEPAVAEIEIEPAVAEIEIEPAEPDPVEIQPAEPEPVEIEIEPKTTEFVPPPNPRRNTAFPGTFAPNSHVATIQNVEAWATLVKALKSSTGPISLVGHTHLEGKHPTDRDNAWLQADSVRALLVTQGLDRDRIAVLGAGTRQPLGSNATAEGRSQNRRVQVLYTRRQTD